MYDREFAMEVAGLARAVGDSEAARRAGVPVGTVWHWRRGDLPHERKGACATIRGKGWGPGPEARMPVNEQEQAAYDEALEEIAALRAVLDVLKGMASMSTRQRIACAEEASRETGLPEARLMRAMGVSRQLLSYHRRRGEADRDGALLGPVAAAFEECGRRGYRAVHATLAREGTKVSEKRVRRVMARLGLSPRRRSRRPYSSYAGEASEAPPNLPLRDDGTHDFSAAAPGELLVTDITEFRLAGGGKAYLSPVVDCFDGMPLSWSISTRPDAALANSSLEAALSSLPPGSAPVVHTDRGCHYRWPGWAAICEAHGATRSMSRKGMSCDNARAEGFFGTLKQEFFYSRDWRGVGPAEFMAELDGWLGWFVRGRIKESLGWLTYVEYRASLGYGSPLAV